MNSILDVIANYTQLHRSGREWKGLCPFHSEKTPSFSVNEEMGLWYCHGCLEGGDVIAFVMKAEGLSFKEAVAHLGLQGSLGRRPKDRALRDRAAKIVAWAEQTSQNLASRLRKLGFQKQLVDHFEDRDVAEWKFRSLERQWTILTRIDDDLFDHDRLPELYGQREIIEGILT